MRDVEFTVDEVKALLGCISSQLLMFEGLLSKEPKLVPIKKALQSAFEKIETAALRDVVRNGSKQ